MIIHISKTRAITLAVFITIGSAHDACAQASTDNVAPPVSASDSVADTNSVTQAPATEGAVPLATASTAAQTPSPGEAKQSAASSIAELQQLLQGNQLAELRTTYNGSYGASLLFYAKNMTYYVVLFQQKNFWRVIKTTDDKRAEAIYGRFASRSAQIADFEIRRTKLEAQKAYTERLIALSQDRASSLQADLSIAREQQALALNRQQQAQADAATLQAQKKKALAQLRVTQRNVADLRREVDAELPRASH